MKSLKIIMPILKVKILGFQIEINYEEKEHKKLLNLVENFKERLSEFTINGKYQNHKIMFLAALKAEDEIYDKNNELNKIIEINKINENQINQQEKKMKELGDEIISLKDNIYQLNLNKSSNKDENVRAFNEINKLENLLKSIQLKIEQSIN